MPQDNRITIQAKAAFLHCFKPFSFNGNADSARYMATLLVDKKDNKQNAKIQNAINAAIEIGKKDLWNGQIPPNLYSPLKDGDLKHGKGANGFNDSFYIVAKSKTAPEICDQKLRPIYDNTQIYSGCIVNVVLTFCAYKSGCNNGVTARLGNIQLVRQGASLYGKTHAKDDFEVIEDEEESTDNNNTDLLGIADDADEDS